MSANEDSLPRLLSGRYRLEAKLGSGGMGVVYRATDVTMQRSVAVKLIRSADGVALDEEVAGRFLREAKNTARVQHENIIEVYGLGRSDQGDMFFVMELLEGESLSAKLRREGKLSVSTSVHIARQICAALHVAHAADIIHRDLKPANVMLIHRAAQDDYVKVLDFGVAKSYTPDQETQLTQTGMVVGTVEYMAPEQILGRKVDGRTDIYALGIVLYRMLTGKAPFRDGGVPALIHAHLNVYPKPLTDTAPELPRALDRVVLRCLAKQPEQRYDSMAELSLSLEAALGPSELGLVSLEYGDAYDSGDKTEVARPVSESLDPEHLVLDESFDGATLKLDRQEPGGGRANRSAAPGGGSAFASLAGSSRSPGVDSSDGTAVFAREESTRRSFPDEVARLERAGPRECAMCRTMNPTYARACNACGASFAREHQDAVRARVATPRTAQLSAPQVPTPASGIYAAPAQPFASAQAALGPRGQGPHGMGMQALPPPQQGLQAGPPLQGWASLPPSSLVPPSPPSMWQRFLSWMGLGGR